MHPHSKNLFKRTFLIILLSFFIMHESNAQKFLAMDKSGSKRLRFYANDEINVRFKNEKSFRNGRIAMITDTSFFLNGSNIVLKDVDAILIRKKTGGHALLRNATYMLPIGGVFITGITAANSAINDHHPLVPKSIYYTAGGLALAGLMIYPLTFRVYRMKHHPLKIIDVSFSVQ
jgi:hypothetical protein